LLNTIDEELLAVADAAKTIAPELGADHVGGAPEPPEVKTLPDEPAAPAIVNAVVKFADAIVGAVSVLLVSV